MLVAPGMYAVQGCYGGRQRLWRYMLWAQCHLLKLANVSRMRCNHTIGRGRRILLSVFDFLQPLAPPPSGLSTMELSEHKSSLNGLG